MSISAEEKMKLLLELGLENAAAKFAEANNLTNLKFRPITEEKIEELLSVEYKEKRPFQADVFVGLSLSTLIIATMSSLGLMTNGHIHVSFSWFLPIVAIGLAFTYYLVKEKMVTETAMICDMPLVDWEDNLPYGALLSVKEAKQQGFKNFTIYFPAKRGSRYGNLQRLKNDPIIVATKKNSNKLYNIFAWDDGKIYE